MWKSLVAHRAAVRWQSRRGIFGFNKRQEKPSPAAEEESPAAEEPKPAEVAEEVGKEYEDDEVESIPVPKSASECLENEELLEIVSTHTGSNLDPHQLETQTLNPSKLRVDIKDQAPSNVYYLHNEHNARTGVKEDRKRGERPRPNRNYYRSAD